MIVFLLYTLLQIGLVGGIIAFCLGCLIAAFKAATARRYAEAAGLAMPITLVIFGLGAALIWLRT